jgi:2-polyprenyl-6-hydroxyphenyl methylase/3-demethylubiquinone-9 3-methyltransferase
LLKTYTEKIKPGGMLLGSTFNRTGLSYLLGIVMAEKVLRWIPRDTHQWGYFLKPSELNTMLLALGFQHIHIQGFGYVPFQWKLSKCTSVNYFFSAQKKAEIS